MLPAFLTTVLFAISAVSANRTTRVMGGVAANFWRITLATILLAIWAHTAGSGLTEKAFPCFLLSGCVGFGLGDLALYQTLPRLGSRLSIVLVHCLAPPFAAAAEWLWLGTTLTTLQVLSSLTILAGVSLALAPGRHLNLSRRVLVSGIIFGSIAAVGQGFGAVLSRKAYQIAGGAGEHIDGLTAAYQRILAGWLVAALTFAIARQKPGLGTEYPAELGAAGHRGQATWYWVVVNALAGPTLGVGCYQWALATHPTGIVLPIVATTPIVVIPFARIMEGEQPRIRSLIGGAIAVAGAVALSGGAETIWRLLAQLRLVF
jgi:drug/metabolite transporter (DMT)-like permease